ncbi:MAG: mechanosensitive ion channel family protein [Tannerella sp.]|jgi:small-conductance mechanosensitive channel|nr:mechanosensitive ion channel family protein [Tannerella sp.]
MERKKIKHLLCVLLIITSQCIAAQEDTVKVAAKTDSVFENNSEAVDLMQKAQTEEVAASLKESIVLKQLSEAFNDKARRQELERELKQIRSADSLRQSAMRRQIDSLKRTSTGAPVTILQDTVLFIYTKFGAFTPQERAERASQKLLQSAKEFILKNDSLTVMNSGSTHDIIFDNIILISVSDLDALWNDVRREDLAGEYQRLLLASIQDYKESTSLANILKMIGLSLLVVIMIFILFIAVNHLFFKVIDRKIIRQKGKFFKGIKIRNLEIINAKRQIKAVLFISKLVRYVLYFLLLYLTLPLLFSIFPVTQRLAQDLFSWILTPIKSIMRGLVAYLPNLVRIIIIIIIIRYIIKFIRYLANEITQGDLVIPGFYPDWAHATYNILRVLLYIFGLVMIFPLLPQSDSSIFQGVSVFVGVVFSLGSTSVIGNVIAGLVITYMRPFKIGDRIKVGDVFGDIIEKTLFVVRVKTPKQEIITVPNQTILSSNVVNYSTSAKDDNGVILYTSVTVSYDVPQQKAYDLLIGAALKTTHILSEPSPFVLSLELGDNAASYQINAYTRHPELQSAIYSELNNNIADAFVSAGIELIIPHYRAVRDGNSSTLPKK